MTTREKIEYIHDLGISRRYMELLLERSTLTQVDLEYVEALSRTLKLDTKEKLTGQ